MNLQRDLARGATALAAGSLPFLLGHGAGNAAPGDQLQNSSVNDLFFVDDVGRDIHCLYRVHSVLTEQQDESYLAYATTETFDDERCSAALSVEVTYTDVDGHEHRVEAAVGPGTVEVRLDMDDVGNRYLAKHVVRFTKCAPSASTTCTAVAFTNPFNPK